MEDVWTGIGVRSVRWKVEKSVLEMIGHVFRNERLTNAAVLGWWDDLERCMGEKTRKYEEGCFALEEDIKGCGDRLNRCGESDERQRGLDEYSAG